MRRLANMILLVSILGFAVVSCGTKDNSESTPTANISPAMAAQAKTVIVRVNSQTNQVEYAPYDGNASNFNNNNVAESTAGLPWQPMPNSQMINNQQGYPTQPQTQWYFVQNPSTYTANYGYYNYPNYYGYGPYQYRHYYPQYYNYYQYYYQPAYYYRNAYYYCWPVAYYPAYYYGSYYWYYLYRAWW